MLLRLFLIKCYVGKRYKSQDKTFLLMPGENLQAYSKVSWLAIRIMWMFWKKCRFAEGGVRATAANPAISTFIIRKQYIKCFD